MKKRSLAFFLCVALLCALWVPLIPAASAVDIADSGTCGENLTWKLDSDGVLTISGAGAMNDYSWWNLPPWGTEVKTVMIENGVTNIGEYAFFDCSALTNITIPGSVKYIGFYAVYGCRSLLSITIPEGVTALGPSALSNCGLISVTLPESLTSIGAGAFGSCFDLKNVSIPNAVTSIGSSAFSYCIALTSITIPASVANIGVAPFRYCRALTEIRVDENNAAYCNDEYGVLFNKDKTELIEAPENAALEDYTIPQSVTYIKDYAFFCCKALKCFTIPASVANIDERAFLSCDNLKSVVFEGDAPSVGSEAFYTRDELTSEYSVIPGLTLYYIEGKEGWTTPEWNGYPTATWDGEKLPVAVLASGTCGENLTWKLDSEGVLTISGAGEMESYFWDWGTVATPWYAHRQAIRTLIIESDVTSIGSLAFYNCTNLTSVSLPDSLQRIGELSFRNCSSLAVFTIPSGVSEIGSAPFEGCAALTEIRVDGDNASYLIDDFGVLFSRDKTVLICCPAGFTGDYVIPNSVTNISESAFYGCKNLAAVTIPENVKNIGGSAFSHCTGLSRLYYNASDAIIPDCTNLIFYNIGASVNGAEVTFGQNVTRIPPHAFEDSRSIKSLVFLGDLTTIGKRAFLDCTGLTSVVFPESLTSIEDEAFGGCTSLNKVGFRGDAPSLGSYVFYTWGTVSGESASIIPNLTLYYIESKEGWTTPEWNGYPTATWDGEKLPVAVLASGTCGENLTWKLDSDGVLTISGSGNIPNYDPQTLDVYEDVFLGVSDAPWSPLYSKIKRLLIDEGVTAIGDYAFWFAGLLEDVRLPESLVRIGDHAFWGCRSLTEISIPVGVATIEDYALAQCSTMKAIHVAAENANYFSDTYGILYNKAMTKLIQVPPFLEGKYVIPESVLVIGKGAFWQSGFTEVVLPEGLTEIEERGLANCCLTQITLPRNVAKIGENAFDITCLQKISVAEENTHYANDAYGILYSKGFTKLIAVPYAADLGFYVLPKALTELKDWSFSHVDGLTGIVLPERLTTIGNHSFYNCKNLTTVVISEHIVSIGSYAFADCLNLQGVYFYGNAPALGEDGNVFTYDSSSGEMAVIPGLTLYYIDGKSGWTAPEWNGYPTATWDGVNVPHTHKYQSVVTAPTCTEKGYTTYTCAICEDSYVADEVAALGHDLVTDAGIAVTCTESGLTEGKHCSRCDYKIERQAIAALGHVWDEGKVTTAPTTEKEGVKTFTCTRCSTTKTEPIDKLQGTVSFKDVDEKAYYAAAVEWAVAKNITKGTAADTFAPNDTCTRGQIVTFLWRAAGEPTPSGTQNPFTDVKQGDYWYDAVLWAVEQGFTTGTSATTFSPNEGCTRGQVATFLWRYENKPAPAAKNPFEDVKKGAYYYDAVLWAVEADVTKGTSATTFAPNDTCTRGQIVTFLYRDIA